MRNVTKTKNPTHSKSSLELNSVKVVQTMEERICGMGF